MSPLASPSRREIRETAPAEVVTALFLGGFRAPETCVPRV